MYSTGECTIPDENVNNSGAIQIAVVVPPSYLQYIFRQSVQAVLKHSNRRCALLHPNFKRSVFDALH